MKKTILLNAILMFFYFSLSAQENAEQKSKYFKTWISLNNNPETLKGLLYETNDSSVIVKSFIDYDYSSGKSEAYKIDYRNLNLIKIRAKNNIGKGVLIGIVSGFITGGVIGLISGDDPPCENLGCILFPPLTAGQKALMGGTTLAICGAGVGALVGSIKIKIPINGSIKTFHENNSRLKRYSYRK